jgi:hypothetical protein
MMRSSIALLVLGGLVCLGGCEADAERGYPPLDPVEADILLRPQSRDAADPSDDPHRPEPQWLIEIPAERPPRQPLERR